MVELIDGHKVEFVLPTTIPPVAHTGVFTALHGLGLKPAFEGASCELLWNCVKKYVIAWSRVGKSDLDYDIQFTAGFNITRMNNWEIGKVETSASVYLEDGFEGVNGTFTEMEPCHETAYCLFVKAKRYGNPQG